MVTRRGDNRVCCAVKHSFAQLLTACKQHVACACVVQVVQQFVGYSTTWWAELLYRLLILLTAGLVWVLCQYHIKMRLWTKRQCPLSTADCIYVQVGVC